MNKTLLLAGVAACLFSTNANAVELKQYISGKLTYSDASHDVKWQDSWNVDNIDNAGETENGTFDFNDDIWGGSFAYGVKADNFRTELELNIKQDAEKTHYETWSFGDIQDIESYKFSVENKSVMINVYYDINTGTKLTPYIGAGIGIAHLKASAEYDGDKFSKSTNNFAWQIGLGAAYALNDHISLDAGYRYTDAGNVKVKTAESTDYGYNSSTTGKFETKSNEFLLGARYSF